MGRPLEGIRVFDMTLAMVGPFATMQLGALGADVIRVEAPEGRRTSSVPPFIKGTSIGYINWNMNKRSVSLDLKQERDRAIAERLVETADVFVENMRPGAAARLGMSYERLSAINPRLVYVSASGWGNKGPMVAVPGADPMVQLVSGWSSINGAPGRQPESYRHYTQNDANTSNYIVQAVLLALLARERTGKGQHIEISMLGGMIALQTTRIAEYFATGKTPPPLGSATTTTVPHQAFLCQDKRWVAVGVEKEEQWSALCAVLRTEHLAADPRFATNRDRVEHRDALIPLLEAVFATKPVYHWVMELTEVGVPAGKFMDWDELRYHPQVTENRHVIQVPTEEWGVIYHGGPPYHFSESETRMVPAPRFGEHTAEILRELAADGAVDAAGD